MPCNACQMVPNDLAFSRIASETLVRSEWERHYSMCFDHGKMTVPIENPSMALGTCRLAHSLFSAFSQINVRTAGPIGMGEALIDVFPPREDDGAS